eukprot:3129870-Amphidinium_carterae.1
MAAAGLLDDLVKDTQLDGVSTVGISAGVDCVTDESLLPALDRNASPKLRAVKAVALYTFPDTLAGGPLHLAMAMVYAAAYYSSISPNTEYNKYTVDPTQTQLEELKAVSAQVGKLLQAATTLLMATKVSWWACNHHVGQGRQGQFNSTVTSKAYKAAMESMNGPMDYFSKLTHALGHCISTREVLIAWSVVPGVVTRDYPQPQQGETLLCTGRRRRMDRSTYRTYPVVSKRVRSCCG